MFYSKLQQFKTAKWNVRGQFGINYKGKSPAPILKRKWLMTFFLTHKIQIKDIFISRSFLLFTV